MMGRHHGYEDADRLQNPIDYQQAERIVKDYLENLVDKLAVDKQSAWIRSVY